MLKLVLLSLCILAVYVNASAKITECKLKSGQVIKVGEEEPEIGTCNTVKCHEDGSISALTCPEFGILPPCKRVAGDKKKLYPGCCDHPVCPPKK